MKKIISALIFVSAIGYNGCDMDVEGYPKESGPFKHGAETISFEDSKNYVERERYDAKTYADLSDHYEDSRLNLSRTVTEIYHERVLKVKKEDGREITYHAKISPVKMLVSVEIDFPDDYLPKTQDVFVKAGRSFRDNVFLKASEEEFNKYNSIAEQLNYERMAEEQLKQIELSKQHQAKNDSLAKIIEFEAQNFLR